MRGERNKLYDAAGDFFDLDGSVAMVLTPSAAVDVCLQAAGRGLIVARIEGGIWHHPGFEARIDCIWDGADPPIDVAGAEANNGVAAEFVRRRSDNHDAFILTAPPVEGWPHKMQDRST
jgi:hypothetical protein